MQLLYEILETLPDGEVLDVRIGPHWTAVVAEVSGVRRCGLAATVYGGHNHSNEPDIGQAGQLEMLSGLELAEFALSLRPLHTGLGIAAINALLPRTPAYWNEEHAVETLVRQGAGKRVAMVGHFAFADQLRPQVGELLILEQNPGPGDLPASAALDVLPQAEVVAITGMALVNHTLEDLLSLCSPQAFVMVLGPSTPLSPVLFNYGATVLSGAVVTSIDPVLRILSQGGNFHQLRRAGVRLVNLARTIE
ncbi:MAG: Rossmann-like domain-containing protein [Chloroflexota bacterium]